MQKSVFLWSSLISLCFMAPAVAQLPASPWDTAAFDAAVAASAPADSGVGHISTKPLMQMLRLRSTNR